MDLNHRQATIAVLEVDPDLAAGLGTQGLAMARAASVAKLLELEEPRWDPAEIVAAADDRWLGLLVTEGLMVRRVTVGKRRGCELFGPGDVFRPWDADGEYGPLPITVEWLVLRPTRLAVLDSAFALRMARWPLITSRLMGRLAQRARYLALRHATISVPRTHARLLLLFWLLAERWGRVSPAGVRINLPLTHEVLGMLVGSQRPSVSIAIKRLDQAGLLRREGRDAWLLTREAMDLLDRPESLEVVGSDDEPETTTQNGNVTLDETVPSP